MSFEPRFRELDDIQGVIGCFVCENLESLDDRRHGPEGRKIRDAAFNEVVAWCTEQFGGPHTKGWRNSRRCIIVPDKTMATAFKLRWC